MCSWKLCNCSFPLSPWLTAFCQVVCGGRTQQNVCLHRQAVVVHDPRGNVSIFPRVEAGWSGTKTCDILRFMPHISRTLLPSGSLSLIRFGFLGLQKWRSHPKAAPKRPKQVEAPGRGFRLKEVLLDGRREGLCHLYSSVSSHRRLESSARARRA